MDVAEKKKYLNWIRCSRPERDAILDEIWALRERKMSASFSMGDGMPKGSGGTGDLSEYAARLDELERLLSDKALRWMEAREYIEMDIARVPNPIERAVLRRRYILDEPWQKIADGIGYTFRQTTRIHGAALVHLEITRMS